MSENIVTIPTGDPSLAGASNLKTGDSICLYGKVTANDENGVSISTDRVEVMSDNSAEEADEPAGESPTEEVGESPTAGATAYVKKTRTAAMA